MPLIPLERFGSAHKFDNTLRKVRESICGINSAFIADIGDNLGLSLSQDKIKPVHYTLQNLALPDRNFNNWRQFIHDNEDMIPVLRIGNSDEMLYQAEDFADLGRGVVLRIRPLIQPTVIDITTQIINSLSIGDKLDHLLTIIDFGYVTEPLKSATEAISMIRSFMISAGNKRLNIATCATSFPREFRGEDHDITRYPIVERQLNQQVENHFGSNAVNLLYSDYASARIRTDEKTGWAGPPRIDYPVKTHWTSNRQRSHSGDPDFGYSAAAKNIMADEDWEERLKIYGANTIREAARGHLDRMRSATSWVPVRINLHLHRHAHFYSSDEEFLGNESNWED